MRRIASDKPLREQLRAAGKANVLRFSWKPECRAGCSDNAKPSSNDRASKE